MSQLFCDAIDRGLKEEDDAVEPVVYKCMAPYCKYCGKTHLRWKQNRQGKWALYTEKGTKHTCKEAKLGFSKVGKTEKVKQ